MSALRARQQMRIRVLAQGGRGHAEWEQVCALLDELSDDEVLAHVEELETELREWAPEFRETPLRWVKQLEREGREPRAQLCRVLGLSSNPHLDELWRVLESPDVAHIDVLGIGDWGLDATKMPDLARRLALIGVKRLELTGHRIGAGLAHILPLSLDGELVSLRADSCGLGHGALEKVVAEGAATGLRELVLSLNYFSPRDLEYLARLPGLDRLRKLVLDDKVLAAGVRVLAEQAPLYGLQHLDLGGTQCGDEGAVLLATAPPFARLEKLSLWSCAITDAGAAALGAATSRTLLRELDLKFNRITATGVRSLLASMRLPELSRINLTGNEIGDDIVDVLASCPLVAQLASLTMDDSYLSNDARAALQALPLPAGVLDLYPVRED